MEPTLLDTDILSELLKQRNATVEQNALRYFNEYGGFCFSIFTRYEILRGCREKNATRIIARFDAFCQRSVIVPMTNAIFERAIDLWVDARRLGAPHSDSDLLIAATALENKLALATGNTAHFQWISALKVTDWRQA